MPQEIKSSRSLFWHVDFTAKKDILIGYANGTKNRTDLAVALTELMPETWHIDTAELSVDGCYVVSNGENRSTYPTNYRFSNVLKLQLTGKCTRYPDEVIYLCYDPITRGV